MDYFVSFRTACSLKTDHTIIKPRHPLRCATSCPFDKKAVNGGIKYCIFRCTAAQKADYSTRISANHSCLAGKCSWSISIAIKGRIHRFQPQTCLGHRGCTTSRLKLYFCSEQPHPVNLLQVCVAFQFFLQAVESQKEYHDIKQPLPDSFLSAVSARAQN